MTKIVTIKCDKCDRMIPEKDHHYQGPLTLSIYTNNGLHVKQFRGLEEYLHICEQCMDGFIQLFNDTVTNIEF